ncbi:MAG: deoxyribonuclease V [bacterium]
MIIKSLHNWDLDYKQAIALQEDLAKTIRIETLIMDRVRFIAGVDVSTHRGSKYFWASVVILNFPELELVEIQSARRAGSFPYIPGLLSFRELPVILDACKKLNNRPDLVICDGQGLAHPRFFGLACHLGLWLDVPTMGCAKSRLVGEGNEPAKERGSFSGLTFKNRKVGALVRTRTNVKPVFVSPGHLTDVESAIEVILHCSRGRRLPEPTRRAHIEVNRCRKSELNSVT